MRKEKSVIGRPEVEELWLVESLLPASTQSNCLQVLVMITIGRVEMEMIYSFYSLHTAISSDSVMLAQPHQCHAGDGPNID